MGVQWVYNFSQARDNASQNPSREKMKNEIIQIWNIETDTQGIYWGGRNLGWCIGKPDSWGILNEAEAVSQFESAKAESKQIVPRLTVGKYSIKPVEISNIYRKQG